MAEVLAVTIVFPIIAFMAITIIIGEQCGATLQKRTKTMISYSHVVDSSTLFAGSVVLFLILTGAIIIMAMVR